MKKREKKVRSIRSGKSWRRGTPQSPSIEKCLRKLVVNMYSSSHYGKRQFPSEIDIYYLRELYLQQEGKCFYSGMVMKTESDLLRDLFLVSVDRITPDAGYVEGNIVLCCLGMNLLKGCHSSEVLFDALSKFYNSSKLIGNVS